MCRLATAGIRLRVEGQSLVARGPLGALFLALAELRARRDEVLAYLKSGRSEAAA